MFSCKFWNGVKFGNFNIAPSLNKGRLGGVKRKNIKLKLRLKD